jgi:hypothetical protein
LQLFDWLQKNMNRPVPWKLLFELMAALTPKEGLKKTRR